MLTRFVDEKFAKNKGRYLFQCFLAALGVFVVLLILNAKENAAVIGALGASAFIAFTMPHAQVSRPRFLVGGYVMGILSGFICYSISLLPFLPDSQIMSYLSCPLFGAVSVGLAIFLMVITNLEHPPAAGVALGLVLNNCDPKTILVVFVGIVSLALIKTLMRRLLIDLL